MSNIGSFGIPGHTEARYSQDREILWGSPQERQVLRTGAVIDSTAVDAGSSPTTVLRRGLLLGKVTATGNLKQYDSAAVDGTEDVYGVLDVELNMLDNLGQAIDRDAPVIVNAPLKSEMLLIKGAAFIGHADQAAATTDLKAKGCVLTSDVL